MEIAYASDNLRTICQGEFRASTYFNGADVNVLRSIVADLYAADFFSDIFPSLYDLIEIEENQFSINEVPNAPVLFKVAHSNVPLKRDGKISWDRVYRIKILKIGDIE